MMVGPCVPSRWREGHWRRIGANPSCIYFNLSVRGIHLFASYQHAVAGRPAELTTPLYPKRDIKGHYFYNTAWLGGVVAITPCLELSVPPSVIGLLLRYVDGRQVCVGRFRLDCCARTIELDSSTGLFLGFAHGENSLPYLAKVDIYPPERAGLTWLDLPWEGKLEWWYSSQECIVSHDCGKSP